MKRLLAILSICAFTGLALAVYAQSLAVGTGYAVLQDPGGRCVFAWGTAAPTPQCQEGALLFRADVPSFYRMTSGSWAAFSPTFDDVTATDDVIATDDVTVGDDLVVTDAASAVSLTYSGYLVGSPTAQTVADSGDGSAAAFSIAATAGVVYVTCSDTDGCAATLSETGAVTGMRKLIVNAGSNNVTIADSAGVQETTGALTLGALDNVWFCYVTNTWVQCMAVTNVA